MSEWVAQNAGDGDDRVTGHDDIEVALLRSGVYATLAFALDRPSAVTRPVIETEWDMLGAALSVLGVSDSGSAIVPIDALEDLDAEFARVFGHTALGGVCPFETEYGDARSRQVHDLADIAGFFAAFGLEVDPEGRERPDHIRCELEFMAFLSRKEAVALVHGDEAVVERTRAAERLFVRDHLGRFGAAFAAGLERQSPNGFYGRVGEILRAFVLSECARHDVDAGPDLLPLSPDAEEIVPMACGEGGSCSAGGCR